MKNKMHEKLVYENDQKYFFNTRHMSMTKKREEDDEVNSALEKFERTMIQRSINKENTLKSVKQKAEEHIKFVMSKLDHFKNNNDMTEEEVKGRLNLEKSLRRKLDCTKERERTLKYKKRDKFEKIRQEQERAQIILQQNEKELAERNKNIMKRVKERDRVLSQKRKHLDSETMQRREIQRLRRENQLYNFKREQALIYDYKSQLIDKLTEKASKAQRAKERSKTA
jgi:hypothetical protein